MARRFEGNVGIRVRRERAEEDGEETFLGFCVTSCSIQGLRGSWKHLETPAPPGVPKGVVASRVETARDFE